MRNLLLVCTVSIFVFITSCEKDNDTNIHKKITFLKTTLGGCNIKGFSDLKSAGEDYSDTVEFTIINEDTLNVFVGINYICCAPFVSENEIIKDTLIMVISDTCSLVYETCYCRCNCYYTWDFKFVDFEDKEYYFIVKLNDPREENTIIFKEGRIDLSK